MNDRATDARPEEPGANRANWATALGLATLGALALWVLWEYAFGNPVNDHVLHARLARQAAKGGGYPPHPAYHFALNALTGFGGDLEALKRVSALVLTVAVVLKLALSVAYARRTDAGLGLAGELTLLAAVFLVTPIANWWMYPHMYLGQFTANVWHNPTVIAVMPFAVAALLLLQGRRISMRNAVVAGTVLALSALVKPNLGMAFAPAAFAVGLARRWGRNEIAAVCLPVVGVLGWQLTQGFDGSRESGLAFEPLAVWFEFLKFPEGTPHPVGSLTVSLAFPVLFLACFGWRREVRGSMALAWTAFAIALAQFLLFAETGEWRLHGNFYWGTVPCLYLVFLTSVVELLQIRWNSLGWAGRGAQIACWAALVAHGASGVLFYVRSLDVLMHFT